MGCRVLHVDRSVGAGGLVYHRSQVFTAGSRTGASAIVERGVECDFLVQDEGADDDTRDAGQ